MDQLDRRSFLTKAAASGLTLAAGAELAAPAAAAITAACKPGPPIPRTIQQAIRGHVFTRSTPGFTGASHVFNTLFDGVMPRWVARPINTADVRAAVRWAVKHHVPMRARSGGHSYAGYSTLKDGLVLDLRKLDGISLNRRTGIATIGAGRSSSTSTRRWPTPAQRSRPDRAHRSASAATRSAVAWGSPVARSDSRSTTSSRPRS